MCRRVEVGSYESKADTNGAPYYLHRLTNSTQPRADIPRRAAGAEPKRANPDILHRVYSALLARLSLSDRHAQNLWKRGLTDKVINRNGYKTLGLHGRARLVAELQRQFGAVLLTVPGFIVKEGVGKPYRSLAGNPGMLIPVRDVQGRIVAIKIRRDDDVGAGPRYSYLSSAKYNGPSPGSPVHVPLGVQAPAEKVRLTEGELKADVAFALSGLPTISAPGVGNWRLCLAVLKDLGCKTVPLAFDMDAREKQEVARALLACAQALIEEGYKLELERWPLEAGKGIDDLLVNRATPELLTGQAALEAVQQMAGSVGVPTESSAALLRLPEVLAVKGTPGLFGDKELLKAIAERAVNDRSWYAKFRDSLRDANVKLRDFDHAIKPFITEEINARPPKLARGETGGFFIANGYICRTKITSDGPLAVELCNFTALIEGETIRDDGVERRLLLGISGALADGTQLPRIEVSAESFHRLDWVVKEWGSDAIVWPGEAASLPAAMQALSRKKTRQIVFAHTGWRKIGNDWYYLHKGGAIGIDSIAVQVEIPEVLAGFELPPPPCEDDLRRAVAASLRLLDLAPDEIMFPLFVAIYRAILGRCDFSLHLVGPTGAFKTELAALCQQHYGAGLDARHLPGSWASTGNALEGVAFAAKDALLVVDDFAPGGSQADVQRYHREAERIFRAQGNHAGRQRMNRDGSLRPGKPPRGLILSTGEDVPRGQSVRARLFTLEVSCGDVDKVLLTSCQDDAAAGLYAQALAGFLKWLSSNYETIRDRLRAEVGRLREQVLASGSHARTPEIVANLGTSLRCLLKFAVEAGAISSAEAGEKWSRGWRALARAAEAQARYQAAAEPAGQFIRLLIAAIASGRAHVAGTDGHEPENNPEAWGWRLRTVGAGQNERDEWQPQGKRIGWVDGQDLYLEPDAAFAEAQALAAEQHDSLPVTPQTLRKRLKERGILASTEQGKLTNRRTLEGRERAILHLATATMEQKPGESGEDPPVLSPGLSGSDQKAGDESPGVIPEKTKFPPIPLVFREDRGTGDTNNRLNSTGGLNQGTTWADQAGCGPYSEGY
jgi:hypothetical protein